MAARAACVIFEAVHSRAIRASVTVAVLVCLASCESGAKDFGTEPVVIRGAGPDNSRESTLLKQVRFAGEEGYDRAVFEFEDAMPYGGFYVEYARSPDGLGDAGCEAPGRRNGADLVVSLHGTGTSDGVPPDIGRRSYTGGERIQPTGTNEMLEAVLYCEFEATVEWVLVLREELPFRVKRLTDPPRIVVDVERRRVTGPKSFFAVTDDSRRLVEVDLATGEVLRTVVDVRRADGGFVAIDGLDIAPDRRTAYCSVTTERGHESVYRVTMPDGAPERLADGSGPSISPDGNRLAFVDRTVIHVRDLRTGEDRTFSDAVGELGGSDTTWSPDGRNLAFATHAADSVGGTGSIDTATGKPIDPQPATPDPTRIYAAYSGRYRPSDGLLAVICCEIPNTDLDDPRHGRSLVLHDPLTGAEEDRLALSFRGGTVAFGATGESDPGLRLRFGLGGRRLRLLALRFPVSCQHPHPATDNEREQDDRHLVQPAGVSQHAAKHS